MRRELAPAQSLSQFRAPPPSPKPPAFKTHFLGTCAITCLLNAQHNSRHIAKAPQIPAHGRNGTQNTHTGGGGVVLGRHASEL